MTNYVISAYPLSREYQQLLESELRCPLNYLVVGEMRRFSPKKLLSLLRNLNADYLFIPLHEAKNQSLLPILGIIAAISKTKQIELVDSTFERKKFPRYQALLFLLGFGFGSLSCWTNFIKSYFQTRWLKKNLLNKNIKSTSNNILYVNANLWFGVKAGGSVGHIAGVINTLSKKFTIDYAAVDSNTLLHSNINYFPLQVPKTFGIPEELNYYRFDQAFTRQLIKKYKTKPPRFIYHRLSVANYTGVVLSRALKVPLVLEYNGSEAWAGKHWGRPLRYHQLGLMTEEVCLNHAHVIVTISEVLRDELIERGISPEKIVFYPNCIDPNIFNPQNFSQITTQQLRKHNNIAEDSLVLTFVGTFGIWHGVDILSLAIRKLIDQKTPWLLQHKVHFLLVGDGVKAGEVKSLLSDEKYQPFITFTGLIPQNQTPGYLAASDILISPHVHNPDGTKFFGSPTKLFEYMAMGKGIIASDLEQIGTVLKNSLKSDTLPTNMPPDNANQLAVLTKPGDVNELIKSIIFMVEQPDWRQKLGANVRKEALAKYTWDNHVNAILDKCSGSFN